MTDALMNAAMLRLWQLISPALPVGAYAYSQGQEYAIDAGWINDEASAQTWITGQLQNNLSALDIPVLKRLYQAWLDDEHDAVNYWTDYLYASREAVELQKEDRQTGMALAKVLSDQSIAHASDITRNKIITSDRLTFATLFSLAGVEWQVPLATLAQGYAWAWCENQITAAIKTVPLGQAAGQRMLATVISYIPDCVAAGLRRSDTQIGAMVPAVAIACAKHETQYTRLFRS